MRILTIASLTVLLFIVPAFRAVETLPRFQNLTFDVLFCEHNREADRLANLGVDEWIRSGAQTPSGSRP